MALAPADFYAYFRATGQPYPESPEERAQQAPEVLEFRRNQLKSQESSNSNPLALGLGIGLGLAGLTGAGLAARRMLRSGKATGQSGVSSFDLSKYDTEQIREAGRTKPTSVAPSKVVMDAPVAPVKQAVDISSAVDDAVADVLSKVDIANTLVDQQQTTGGFNVRQAIAALESGEDQATGRVKNQLQRNEDLDLGQIEILEDIASEQRNWMMEQDEPINRVASQLPDGVPVDQTTGNVTQHTKPDTDFVRFSRQAENVSAEAARVASQLPDGSPVDQVKRKPSVLTSNPWETEELLEEMGNANRRYQENIYEKGGRIAADLTGTLSLRSAEDAKKLRALGVNVRGNQVRLAEFSDSAGREGIGINRLSPQEILDRTMASVSYPREMRDMFLNPNIKTEDLKKYLGEAPEERAGRVSANPTFEIAGGAAASMPGSPTYSKQTRGAGGEGLTNLVDTTDWQQLRQIEQLNEAGLVRDPNTGNFVQMVDDVNIDPTEVMTGGKYGGAEYGDTEGVGNLLIETEAFKEKTNQGTTMIPGATQTMRGAASGSEREERFQDVVLPLRRDADNAQTRGIVAAPSYEEEIKNINALLNADAISFEEANALKGKLNADANLSSYLKSLEVGNRQNKRVVSADINTQGSKLVGGSQSDQVNVSQFLTTQPVSEWRKNSGVIKGDDGLLYSAPGKELLDEEEPLVGYRRSRIPGVKPDAAGSPFVDVPNAPLTKLTLSRSELQDEAEAAKDAYFNNPKEKAAYLRRVDPELLTTGLKQGLTLADIGEPYHYQNFITERIDNFLMNKKGINLPILKEGDYGIDKAGTTFAMNLLKTEKNTPVYGKKFKVDSDGRLVPLRDEKGKMVTNRGGYIVYATDDEKIPIPGRYETTGGGGVDPMTIGEDYPDKRNVAFFTPRISTTSQQRLIELAQNQGVNFTGTANTQVGSLMSKLRREMETPGARNARISTGSTARTSNPYTGSAAAASGPASRVLEGNYQYTPGQLKVLLEPTSQRQLQERNQLALNANLTPGGRVVRGALNLGEGMGVIPAGLGNLSESETVSRYGTTGAQLQDFGNKLMAQAAYKRGVQPGPTINRAINKVRVPGGSDQPVIPGVLETNPLSPRGYTPDSALDFYTKALERDTAENYVLKKNPRKDLLDEDEVDTWSFADRQPKERMVRRQGRMVPLSQTVKPIQRNVFYQRG